jgi:hypothetical protein
MLLLQITPSQFETFSMQGELILEMTYGYEAQGHNDRKIEISKQLCRIGFKVGSPGGLLVNDLAFRMCHFIL